MGLCSSSAAAKDVEKGAVAPEGGAAAAEKREAAPNLDKAELASDLGKGSQDAEQKQPDDAHIDTSAKSP